MPKKKHGVIIETPTDARQAERGTTILSILLSPTALAVFLMGIIWFVFFRT